MLDTREEGKKTVDDVSVVWEYVDQFLEDFLGLAPVRQVELSFGLIWF